MVALADFTDPVSKARKTRVTQNEVSLSDLFHCFSLTFWKSQVEIANIVSMQNRREWRQAPITVCLCVLMLLPTLTHAGEDNLPFQLKLKSSGPGSGQLYSVVYPSMGSLMEIQLVSRNRLGLELALQHAFSNLDRLESLISHYRSGSEVSRLNYQYREGYIKATHVSEDTIGLLRLSRLFWEETQGAFDSTLGPLSRLWGFFDGVPTWPGEADLKACMEMVGMRHIEIDFEEKTVRLTRPGMALDFGAIGKGYAVDQMVGILRSHGIVNALISFGGSTHYAIGRPPGQEGWWIFLDESNPASKKVLKDKSLSTASNRTQHWVRNGKNYGHILDPRTGLPTSFLGSVSVVASTATASDALATAFVVLGPEGSAEVLSKHPEWEVVFVPHIEFSGTGVKRD